jgi:hypothetical protein
MILTARSSSTKCPVFRRWSASRRACRWCRARSRGGGFSHSYRHHVVNAHRQWRSRLSPAPGARVVTYRCARARNQGAATLEGAASGTRAAGNGAACRVSAGPEVAFYMGSVAGHLLDVDDRLVVWTRWVDPWRQRIFSRNPQVRHRLDGIEPAWALRQMPSVRQTALRSGQVFAEPETSSPQ